MKLESYQAVRVTPDGVGVYRVPRALIKVAGRDRLSFLQGQVSQDVAALEPGQGARACLLNSTGHIMADLVVLAFDGHVVVETDPERGAFVRDALERYVIREKVLFDDLSSHWIVVSLHGSGVRHAWETLLDTPIEIAGDGEYASAPLPLTASDATEHGVIVKRNRLGAQWGFDVWLPPSIAAKVLAALYNLKGVRELDHETFEILRVEAGKPVWGAELDETVIPLEAELDDAISFSKGCYLGQEIIARIKSRGHTNRSLRRLRLSAAGAPGDEVFAVSDEPRVQSVGRITSAAVSPVYGPIAMAYVRNEYAVAGGGVQVNGAPAIVEPLAGR